MKPEDLEIGKLYWMQINNCEAIMMPQDLTTVIGQNFSVLPAYEFKVYATTNSKWTDLFSTISLNSLRITFFSGSVNFVDGLEKTLLKNGFNLHRGKKDPRFLSISKKSIVFSLYKFLYNNSKISLDRKRVIFEQWIQRVLDAGKSSAK